MGGDSDTIAAIVGGVAEAYYGVPLKIKNEVMIRIPEEFKVILNKFYHTGIGFNNII